MKTKIHYISIQFHIFLDLDRRPAVAARARGRAVSRAVDAHRGARVDAVERHDGRRAGDVAECARNAAGRICRAASMNIFFIIFCGENSKIQWMSERFLVS